MNIGLFSICVGSLLPVDMESLLWMPVTGDTLFALGAFTLVAFVFTTYSTGRNSLN